MGGAPAAQVSDANAGGSTLQVAVPETAKAGSTVQFVAPGGQTVNFVVPDGVAPGTVVTIAVPAATAVALPADGKVYGEDLAWLLHQPKFVDAAAKSTTRNFNANPQRKG